MKKYLAVVILLAGVASPVFADVEPIVYANGPIVPQVAGGRFLKPGQEDCPAWFPYSGCYTMRSLGALFVPLQ